VSHAQWRWWRWHDTTAPTAPKGVTATAITPTTLTLSWNAATDNVAVTGYNVYCNGTLLFPSSTTSVQITELLAGRTCAFTIAAFDAAGNVSALSAPLSVTTPVLPTLPEVLWSAGMETGDLSEWSEKVNSGSADSVPVTAASAGIPPKTGNWVMRQSVTGSSGGTRMHRYPEADALSRAGTTFYWSWWDYYPTRISFGPSDMFMLWQLASNDAAGVGQPLWGLYFNGSNSTLILGWNPAGGAPAEGPHAGESGPKAYTSVVPVPVAQWVFFEVMIKPAGDFTGAIKIWMNGQVIFDQSLVKTRFPYVGLAGYMYATNNAYGSGLTPIPAHHYVDDVTISLGRMPYP